jgi:two-component system sensor histidine kinase/response regulator
MHCKFEVVSEPVACSAFSFTAQFGIANTLPSAARDLSLAGVLILLVDDNTDSRAIVCELLTARGAQVIQASSAAGALAELRADGAHQSRFRVVLIDGTMPLQVGFEVAEYLVSGGQRPPRLVMMLATNDLACEVARLRALGVDNYIVKPVRRAELFAAVARVCAGVRIDAHGEKFEPPPIAPSAPSALLNRPLRILMADDSRDNRALIRAYLKKTPYHLEDAEDGQQAIDKFIAGNFDLVLMDIQMPIVDGYEATSTIRVWEVVNSRHRTPIVALTASALEEAVYRSKEAGCDAHVTKPVKKSTLLDAIRDAVEAAPSNDARTNVANPKEEPCRTG